MVLPLARHRKALTVAPVGEHITTGMNKIEIHRPPPNAPFYVQAVVENQLDSFITAGEKIHFVGQLRAATMRLLDQHRYNVFVLKKSAGLDQDYYLERCW
jgi:hypothetical protein